MDAEPLRAAFILALEKGATHGGVDILGAGQDVTIVRLGEITATPQGEFSLSHRLLRLARGYRYRLFLAKEDERLWEGLIY